MTVLVGLLFVGLLGAGFWFGWTVRTWLADAPQLRTEVERLRAEREIDRLARRAAIDMVNATMERSP